MSGGRRRAAAIAGALAATACVGEALWMGWARPRLLRAAESALAAKAGAPATVDSLRLRSPTRIELRGLRAARGEAERARIEIAPLSLLRGRPVVRAIDLENVHAAIGLDAARVRLVRSAADECATVEDLRYPRLAAHADRVHACRPILENVHDRPTHWSAEGAGIDLAGLGPLRAWIERDGDRFRLALDGAGLVAEGALDGDRVRGRLDAARVRLPALVAAGVDLSGAGADGSARVGGTLDDLALDLDVALDGLAVDRPSLAARRVEGLGGRLVGSVRVVGRGARLSTPGLTVERGPLTLRFAGSLERRAGRLHAANFSLDIPRVSCSAALAALRPLLPTLDGMQLDGGLAAHVGVSAPPGRLADLELDLDPRVDCRVLADPPAADAHALLGPLTVELRDPAPRAIRLAPDAPSFRPLPSLPPELVRAFVVAEDGKFLDHAGFDPWTIRRALAADLEAGAFERGASTITQQVAKNVFLDGERSLSRKLEEAVLAWRLEQVVPKRRLLEAYLNLVELGPDAYGVVEGARRWFGKDPSALTPAEAAQLAALLPAPRRGMDDAWAKRVRDLVAKLRAGECRNLAERLRHKR